MLDITLFAPVLTGALERVGALVVEKAVAMGGAWARRGEEMRRRLGGQPPAASLAAVEAAVEEARLELIREHWAEDDATSREVVTLLQHRPFAEEVTRRLLFHGPPDFDRLRRHYLADEGASERWQALEPALGAFFELVEHHLEADERFGPLLRDTRQLAAMTRLEEGQQVLIEVSRTMASFQARTAAAGEDSAAILRELLEAAGRREARLDQLVELVRGWLERRGGAVEGGAGGGELPLTAAEQAYLRLLRKECDRLPLADDVRAVGSGTGTTANRRASLANVYVDLETTTGPGPSKVLERLQVPEGERGRLLEELRGRGGAGGKAARGAVAVEEGGEGLPGLLGAEGAALRSGELGDDHPLRPWVKDEGTLRRALRPLSALEALAERRHLVLLGDPGSGKSTFVNHLAATFAGALLGEGGEGNESLGDAFPEPLFPVRVVLRRWSGRLEAREGEEAVKRVYRELEHLAEGVPRERWLERLASPSTLVLFDGLDEVPAAVPGEEGPDLRGRILEAVEGFRTAHPHCLVLMTCRVKPYRDPAYQLEKVPALQLAPLDAERIRRFTALWYEELAAVGQLAPEVASERGERLLAALGQREELGRMAGTPLLLTMLAQVNAHEGLPEGRAQLYERCTEQLLWSWEESKSKEGGEVESLGTLLTAADIPKDQLRPVLWDLAFENHGRCARDAVADLPERELESRLAKLHPHPYEGKGWAARVVDLMRDRGGLLAEEEPGVFSFPHRGFQEYLAARQLVLEPQLPVRAAVLSASDVWWEVVELACGHLTAESRYSQVQEVVYELLEGEGVDAGHALLAGRIWREFTPWRRATGAMGQQLTRTVPARMTALMRNPSHPPARRLEAGEIAADLGELPADLDAWVEIPDDCGLGYGFKIGKYPVTNVQFRRFVEAGGYDPERRWWTEEAKKEILEWENGEWPSGPRYWNDRGLAHATQPVLGVSWYEMMAYCAWWAEELRKRGELKVEEEIRLPTVAEWHRAAAGADGKRPYPWGKDFDRANVNSEESGLSRPTPVHMYPGGASPEGVLDLCGNVWEWTADRHEKVRSSYVLVGGAWYKEKNNVQASARFWNLPYDWSRFYGFRCVVVPSRA